VSPPVAAAGPPRWGALGRPPPQRGAGGCWGAVVARHAGEDWPPPEWLATTAEGGSDDAHEAPVLRMPAEERAAA